MGYRSLIRGVLAFSLVISSQADANCDLDGLRGVDDSSFATAEATQAWKDALASLANGEAKISEAAAGAARKLHGLRVVLEPTAKGIEDLLFVLERCASKIPESTRETLAFSARGRKLALGTKSLFSYVDWIFSARTVEAVRKRFEELRVWVWIDDPGARGSYQRIGELIDGMRSDGFDSRAGRAWVLRTLSDEGRWREIDAFVPGLLAEWRAMDRGVATLFEHYLPNGGARAKALLDDPKFMASFGSEASLAAYVEAVRNRRSTSDPVRTRFTKRELDVLRKVLRPRFPSLASYDEDATLRAIETALDERLSVDDPAIRRAVSAEVRALYGPRFAVRTLRVDGTKKWRITKQPDERIQGLVDRILPPKTGFYRPRFAEGALDLGTRACHAFAADCALGFEFFETLSERSERFSGFMGEEAGVVKTWIKTYLANVAYAYGETEARKYSEAMKTRVLGIGETAHPLMRENEIDAFVGSCSRSLF